MQFLSFIVFLSLLSPLSAIANLVLVSTPGYIIHFDENFGGWATTKSLVDKIMEHKPGGEDYNRAFEEGVTFVYEHSLFYTGILAAKIPSDFITLYYLALAMQAAMPASAKAGDPRVYLSGIFGFLHSQCGVDPADQLAFVKLGICLGAVKQQLKREYITYSIEILGVWKAMKETGELTVEQLREWKQAWDEYFSTSDKENSPKSPMSYDMVITMPSGNVYERAFMLSGLQTSRFN